MSQPFHAESVLSLSLESTGSVVAEGCISLIVTIVHSLDKGIGGVFSKLSGGKKLSGSQTEKASDGVRSLFKKFTVSSAASQMAPRSPSAVSSLNPLASQGKDVPIKDQEMR